MRHASGLTPNGGRVLRDGQVRFGKRPAEARRRKTGRVPVADLTPDTGVPEPGRARRWARGIARSASALLVSRDGPCLTRGSDTDCPGCARQLFRC